MIHGNGVRMLVDCLEACQEFSTLRTETIQLSLPLSIVRAARRLARQDGVALDHWIATAIAQKVSAIEAQEGFLARRAGNAKAEDMLPFLHRGSAGTGD